MLERTPTSGLNNSTRRNVVRRVKQRRWIVIDAESRSTVDLATAGPDVYARNPQTECRKLAIIGDDGSELVWHPGDPVPPIIFWAVKNLDCDIIIHNAPFDHTLWAQNLHDRHNFPLIPYARCVDTMTRALAGGWPAGLGELADALEFTHRKDREGERAMRRAMRPRKAKKGEDPNVLHYPPDPPDEYALQDARVAREAHLHRALSELPPAERKLEVLTHKINAKGIPVDIKLAEAICKIGQEAALKINAELAKITRNVITSTAQIGKLLEFAKANGYRGLSLDAEAVARQLARKDLPPLLRRVLMLRAQGGGAAIKKFNALLACVSSDGRIRHWAQYWGAGPGRWAGRRFQPQNLRRLTIVKDIEATVAAIKTGNFEHMNKLFEDKLLDVLGEMGRPVILASPGHTLIGGDLSAIESRVLAWIADERWKIEAYKKYDGTQNPRDEPYCETACRIKRKPSGTFTKTSPERALGKVCDLAFGYQGGLGAWRIFMPDDYTDDEAETFKRDWRAAHPAISKFWRLINKATVLAVERPDNIITCGRLELEFDGVSLGIRLPSGRKIMYPQATIIEGLYGPVVSFADNSLGQFKPVRNGLGGYGGLWTENIVQGIARDILGAAMLRIEAANYPIILHVHDEVVCEVPIGFGGTEEFTRLLITRPRWCMDLPISASAWAGQRYCK